MTPLSLADVCLVIIAVCSTVLTVHFVQVMAATSPQPFTITHLDDELRCRVRRTVGFSITCPTCHDRKVARTKTLARVWLYGHICRESES